MQIWLTPSTGRLSLSATAYVPLGKTIVKAGTFFNLSVGLTDQLSDAIGTLGAKLKGSK